MPRIALKSFACVYLAPSLPWSFSKAILFAGPNKRLRFLSCSICESKIFFKRSLISRNSGGNGTTTFSNSNAWRYGFTSGESLVLTSISSTARCLQISFTFSESEPGEAVRPRIKGFSLWRL